jgi:hypothetical protein
MLLNKLGNDLLGCNDSSALCMISKVNGSVDALVGIILNTFPAFCDYVNVDAPSIAPSRECEEWTQSMLGGRQSRAGPTRSPSGWAPCALLR